MWLKLSFCAFQLGCSPDLLAIVMKWAIFCFPLVTQTSTYALTRYTEKKLHPHQCSYPDFHGKLFWRVQLLCLPSSSAALEFFKKLYSARTCSNMIPKWSCRKAMWWLWVRSQIWVRSCGYWEGHWCHTGMYEEICMSPSSSKFLPEKRIKCSLCPS